MVCAREGSRFVVRPNTTDMDILWEVLAKRVYAEEGLEIGEWDTIVDIGAHIGVFTVLAARSATHGKVFSFEPMPENYRVLQENIRLNGLENVTSFNVAVASRDGQRDFFVDRNDEAGHSLIRKEESDVTRVDTISLATFLEDQGVDVIDFLKADCEGAEYEILLNLPPQVLERIRRISMECHVRPGIGSSSILKRHLESNGFIVRMIDGENYLHAISKGKAKDIQSTPSIRSD